MLICYDVMNPVSYDNVLIKVRPLSLPACLPRGAGRGVGTLEPAPALTPGPSPHSGSLRSRISAVGPPWCSWAARRT